jgi:hypothetical protein
MQRKRRNSNNNWIGTLIFLMIVFGSTLSRFIVGVIFGATGVLVDSNLVFIGLIILAVAVSVFGSLARGLGRINSGSESKLPTIPSIQPPTFGAGSSSSTPPPTFGAGSLPPQMEQTQLPGSPRYEPVIDPRVLVFGIVGLIVFGIVFLVILSVTGVI